MCVDRDQIIDVVFAGYATKVESIVGHISGKLENPNLGPLQYDCARGQRRARQARLQEGLERHPRRPRDDRCERPVGAPDAVRDPDADLDRLQRRSGVRRSSGTASRSSGSR